MLASSVPPGAPAPPPVFPLPPPAQTAKAEAEPRSARRVSARQTRRPSIAGAARYRSRRRRSDHVGPERCARTVARASRIAAAVVAADRRRGRDNVGGERSYRLRCSVTVRMHRWAEAGQLLLGPKILPIRLLMNDPLPACVGGGGTTVFDGSGMLPLARRCVSCEMSAEGGGAMTAGAGKFSWNCAPRRVPEPRPAAAMTAVLVICTGGLEISRLTPPGAGGITLAASAGVERD